MITAIVTAAGMSTRMGTQNKLLLPLKGKALFLHLVDALIAANVEEVIVVSGHENKAVEQALGDRQVQIVFNKDYALGLTTSIQAGVRNLKPKCEGFLVCLSDMPFVTTDYLNAIVATFKNLAKDKAHIVIPKVGEKRAHPILFSKHFAQAILDHKVMTGCKGVIQNNNSAISFVNFKDTQFNIDIDTEEEYNNLNTI